MSYHTTKKEAILALAEYNHNPYDIDSKKITFKEVWEMWAKDNWEKGSPSTQKSWTAGFKNCKAVHNMPISDIKLIHLEGLMKDKGRSTQGHIKTVCSKIFKYSVKHEWIDKDPSSYLELNKAVDVKKVPFTDKEIDELWEKSKTDEFSELVLVLLYTGLRISELLDIEQKDVFDDYMIGGTKTEAGRNRIIPLHSKIRPFIKKRMDGEQYLVHRNGKKLTYAKFHRLFLLCVKNHTIHETRHTFISRMHSAGVNEVTIKIIVGHAFNDVTSKVYIHKDKDELLAAVEKL